MIITSFNHIITKCYDPEALQSASYDLHAAERVVLPPHTHGLVSTMEHTEFPNYIAGQIVDKSSFLRRGIHMGQGWIDPGFHGNLTVSIINYGKEPLIIEKGQPFCQLILNPVLNPQGAYDGHYQNSEGITHAA